MHPNVKGCDATEDHKSYKSLAPKNNLRSQNYKPQTANSLMHQHMCLLYNAHYKHTLYLPDIIGLA